MFYGLMDAYATALGPMRLLAQATSTLFQHPLVPAAHTRLGHAIAAGAHVLESVIRPRGKPDWGLDHALIDGASVPVTRQIVAARPFCDLIRFVPAIERAAPKLLLVAPMSGHYATLLRGTAQALMQDHDLYVTDWVNARLVPAAHGPFGLDAYIAYLMEFMRLLGPDTHVVAVCQPAPLVLSAVALLAAADDSAQPRSMILMGGPIDTAAAETAVTRFALNHPISWFERRTITHVPAYYPGAWRRVYPGFLQLSAFIAMHPTRHLKAHVDMFNHLVRGDGESAQAHRRFYDEYLSVMDVTAEFYLETVQALFQENRLATGCLRWRDQPVEPGAIRKTALMTVEGELDDISAPGQTLAAHHLCRSLPDAKRAHYLQTGVGHYGIFNGRKWREQIMPAIARFVRDHD